MEIPMTNPDRRRFLGFAGLAAAALALPGCASYGGFSFTDAIRRLLMLSSERSFARLLADGGFYDTRIARAGLEGVLGTRGGILASILTSGAVKDRLVRALADVAAVGADRAAPVIADTIRVIGIGNAYALVTGEPTAATAFLRRNMGARLVDVMLPEVGDALRVVDDPAIGPALSALSGVDLSGLANGLVGTAEETIWHEIGVEEALIRQNPRDTNDPVLIGVFGAA